jgi:elongation factor P
MKLGLQYSYFDGENYVFMDTEDFSQFEQSADDLEGQLGYLVEGMEGIIGLLMDGKLLAVELPQTVSLSITDTAPGIKGATATGRTKPATLSTGLEVQVPEYLEPGETIKINTQTGKFMSRD